MAGPLGAIGEMGGYVLGDMLGSDERDRQRAIYGQLLDMYQGLPVEVRAELEEPSMLGPSAMQGVAEDPLLRASQLRALRGLEDTFSSGGMDPQARAALAQSQAATAGQERAQRGNILDAFARGGQRNSNAALLASLTAQQGAAQRAGLEGLQAAGDASARQYRALLDAGSLAGGVRSQDFGVASARAGAADRVSEYNAAARNAAMSRNADRRMAAQQGTISNRFRQAEGISDVREGQLGRLDEERRRKLAFAGAGGSSLGQVGDYATGWGG